MIQYACALWLLCAAAPALAQPALTVGINASAVVVKTGRTVQFLDQSAGSPTEWTWSFPGATPSTSSDQNPFVTYTTAGTYSVTLSINNAEGDVAVQTFMNYIEVKDMNTFWWNDAVFYEVFVRSFKDHNGDGNGDLQGLMAKLDYLNDGDPTTHSDLGVTAIWLMPVQQSPSYHGYDVTDYRAIEQDYGNNAEFQALMAAAHQRGIKVIIDFVMNHTSSQHPWFLQSTSSLNNKRDWYRWTTPKPTETGPWGQTVWYTKNSSNYYAIFWSEMPDLNYATAAVKDEMFDVARFWLEDMGVDGFRLDAVKYIFETPTTLEDAPSTIQFWKDFRTYYKSVNPEAFAVGEAWTSTDKVAPYVENDGLDYCFDFDLAEAMLNAVNGGTASALTTQVDEVMDTYPFLQFGSFLTNHDINRVMDRLGKNSAKARLASDLLLTLPGIPYIYYGEEIGMTGSKPDENIRTPMQWDVSAQGGFTSGTPWRAVNADYTTKNVAIQQFDANSLWTNYNRLIRIRQEQIALRRGNYLPVNASVSTVFSFLRQYEDENILVVSNLSSLSVNNVQLTLTHGGIIPANYQLVELQGGNSLPLVVDIAGGFSNFTIATIPARSTLIYKLLDPSATSASVTFQVNMNALITSGDFDASTETVDIVAEFNNYGTPTTTVLSDAEGDGVYSVTLNSAAIGTKFHYKYRMNGLNDGTEEFSTSAYLREYLVPEGEDTITDIYQRTVLTGITYSLMNTFYVYPVPASNELYVSCPQEYADGIYYRIADLSGEERTSASLMNTVEGLYHISTDHLPSGFYLLTLDYKDNRKIFKISIQK